MRTISVDGINLSAIRGRSVIITGGASGIGQEVTKKFAANGAYVTIADVQDDLGRELAERLCGKGNFVTFVHCDISNWDSSKAAFRHAVNFCPGKTLDVAILLSGRAGDGRSLIDLARREHISFEESDPGPEPPHTALDINLYGVFFSTYLSLYYFQLPPSGSPPPTPFTKSLVMVTAVSGYGDAPNNSEYGASMFGVRGLFRGLRSRGHVVNARINNVVPSWILTPLIMNQHGIKSPDDVSKILGCRLPWVDPKAVVNAILVCALDETIQGKGTLHI